MKIILLGVPGVGKGTQASFIENKFKVKKISTGDMLREAVAKETELGKQVKDIMERGEYVSDEIMLKLVQDRILQVDCANGFILDGFPRTLAQAKGLDKLNLGIDFVIEIFAPDEEIVKRLSGRRVHIASGRVYHIENNPPEVEGVDDITGEPLVHREDDKPKTILKRLEVYHTQTSPLINFYKTKAQESTTFKYIYIDGVRRLNEVSADIEKQMTKN